MEILDKIIASGNISHAYLFQGPVGQERDGAVAYFVRSLMCETMEPGGCGLCRECRRIDGGNHPSITRIVAEKNTIKIAQTKELQAQMAYRHTDGRYQIYIIVEAERMTPDAANSLLKFIEEPPASTIGILTTSQADLLLPTIVSRCQLIKLAGPSQASFVELRTEDQEKFASFQKIMVQLNEDFQQARHGYIHLLDVSWFAKKPGLADHELLLDYMIGSFRALMRSDLGLDLTEEEKILLEDILAYRWLYPTETLALWLVRISETKEKLRRNINPQLAVEAMLIRMQEEL